MVPKKVSDNFYYYEYGPHGCSRDWVPENEYQKLLIDSLAKNIQLVRTGMPAGTSITITSGVRTSADYVRLTTQGYNPSATSDHYCGAAVPVDDPVKANKFGRMYYLSTGAADCVPNGMKVPAFFDLVMSMCKAGVTKFGQVIHEFNPTTKAEWVHMSGDYESIFSKKVCDLIGRQRFMSSMDGGKTYVAVK